MLISAKEQYTSSKNDLLVWGVRLGPLGIKAAAETSSLRYENGTRRHSLGDSVTIGADFCIALK